MPGRADADGCGGGEHLSAFSNVGYSPKTLDHAGSRSDVQSMVREKPGGLLPETVICRVWSGESLTANFSVKGGWELGGNCLDPGPEPLEFKTNRDGRRSHSERLFEFLRTGKYQ